MATQLGDARMRVKIETDDADRSMDDLEKEIDRSKKARGEEKKERGENEKEKVGVRKDREASAKERIAGGLGRVAQIFATVAGAVAVAGGVAAVVRDQLKELGKDDPSGIVNSIADNVIGRIEATLIDPLQERIIAVETALPAISETALVAGAMPRLGVDAISPSTIKAMFDGLHGYRQQQAQIDFEVKKINRVFEARAVKAALIGGFESLKAEVGL